MIDASVEPFIPKGWSIVRHRALGFWSSEENMCLDVVRPADGEQITGYEFLHRLLYFNSANAKLLTYFLKKPEFLLKNGLLKEGEPLFFFGTVYKDCAGKIVVCCLCLQNIEGDQKVFLGWRCLEDLFRISTPALFVHKD